MSAKSGSNVNNEPINDPEKIKNKTNYTIDEGRSKVDALDVRLQELVNVFVVDGVLDITVQIPHVDACPNGEPLLNILGPDELAALLPNQSACK